MNPEESSIADLIAAGRWAEAAAALRAAGQPARACTIYERLWDFASAAACAREAGDDEAELRNLLDAKQVEAGLQLAERMGTAGAARVLEARRQLEAAARLWERLGERARAAGLFARASAWLEAGRVHEGLGEEAEAGRHYERAAAEAPEPRDAARAHLALAKLHARRGKHDLAARHLQEAARHDECRKEAVALLPIELAALGLREAAQAALARAREIDGGLPAELDVFLRGRQEPGTTAAAGGAASDGEAGRLLGGRYRLGKLLGAGGSGRVHVARDELAGSDVAVKLFFAAQARGPDAYARFVREARVCGALKHPHIVEVLDFREDLGFYAMELMAGGTLADRMTPRMPPAPLKRAALDVLAGLEAAHGRGVVHRDLKPANIFFDAKGTAKLGDFGVAHLLDLGQTQTGGLIGTLAYMAPEQITGAPLTYAADLYALGVTLYHALTGRLPLPGPDFVAQHLGEAPPPASSLLAEAAPWDALLARLLAKAPEARHESLAELRAQLGALDTGARVSVLVLGGVGASQAVGGAPTVTPVPLAVAVPTPAVPSLATAARYGHEAPLGDTPVSSLARALDVTLSRSVVIERFAEGHPDAATEQRLVALAGAMGPHLQRVLSFERATRTMVLEAPVGETLSARLEREPLPPRAVARLLAELAAALAPLHAAGAAHGAITAERVLVEPGGAVTLVVAGLGALPTPPPTTEDDLKACLALATRALASATLPAWPVTTAADLAALARSYDADLAHSERLATHLSALATAARTCSDPSRALTQALALALTHGLTETAARALLNL